jgi:hypothetical protein
VFGDVRLNEQRCLLRIDSSRQQSGRHLSSAIGQSLLVVLAGDGVQVHDADQRLVATLQIHPVLHRPEPVADMQLAGRLNT